MKIKKNLKTLDVKISKLASDLGISRPTLDTYIDYYEKGLKIPNEAYQQIFEYLFSEEEMNSIEFAQKYDYVKRIMLKDAKNSAEQLKIAKRENMLLDKIRKLGESKIDKPLLEFINLFINNKDNDLVKAIYMYFNFTNGFENIDNYIISNKDMALFSQLMNLFDNYNNNSINLIEEMYIKLKEKNKNIFEQKKVKVNNDEIIDYIKSNLNDSNIDIDVLRKMLESREDK